MGKNNLVTDADLDEKVVELFGKIKAAKHCVAFTGAGISTLSGIRDFRGKNGLYKEFDAQRMFDIDYFEKDPTYYYKTAGEFIYNADDYPASIVHKTLAKLEGKGLLKAIITQNIDFLHQKGGAKHVIEVHGSPSVHYCLYCSGVNMPFEEAVSIVKKGGLSPLPQVRAYFKAGNNLFGEMLPVHALREAEHEASTCDLMLVLGTSITVYPAAGIPNTALRNGAEVVIVNNLPTPMDDDAVLKFGELAPVFESLNKLAEAL